MQFGVNDTPEYKAMNPNGLARLARTRIHTVGIPRHRVYLARSTARASFGPTMHALLQTLTAGWSGTARPFGRMCGRILDTVRTPPEKRNMAEVEEHRKNSRRTSRSSKRTCRIGVSRGRSFQHGRHSDGSSRITAGSSADRAGPHTAQPRARFSGLRTTGVQRALHAAAHVRSRIPRHRRSLAIVLSVAVPDPPPRAMVP